MVLWTKLKCFNCGKSTLVLTSLDYYNHLSGFFNSCLFFFPPFIFISWRLILQYCSGFWHTLTWISRGFTCVPHSDPPSRLPLHPIPLGLPSAPALSTCLMHKMQLWTMKLLLLSNFGNKQMEKPTTSVTVSFQVSPLWYSYYLLNYHGLNSHYFVSFQVSPLWYRYYLLNYHGLNSHYFECWNHPAWETRTLEAQAQQIFRWKEMNIIYSLDSPLVLVTWPNSRAEKRGKPGTGEKHERYCVCVRSVMSDSLQLHGL